MEFQSEVIMKHCKSVTAFLLIVMFIAATSANLLAQTAPATQRPAPNYPAPQDGDYKVTNFKFRDGNTLPELNMHYATIGTPQRDAKGHITNAVMFLHGTGGTGRQFLNPVFANDLFGPGQLLDAAKYYLILVDNIGHGKSSKPSDGMHMKFPSYDYDDMVELQHKLLIDGLHVDHLRLILGTSMGCMHVWVWGETYPDFMDALMPLACQTVQIAGRNRIMRKMAMDAIRNDPDWKGGEYSTQPIHGLTGALNSLILMGSAPLQMQKTMPTRDLADKYLDDRIKSGLSTTDANDFLYYFNSSRNYDPSKDLEKVSAYVMYVNSADDTINPPELGIAEKEIKRVKHGKFVLLPITDQTRGHGTHTIATIWKQYLSELLEESKK